MKTKEIRDMSRDQLLVTLKDAREAYFRLRVQARMEKLDAPSELKKNKQLIARILTVMNEQDSK